MVANNDFQLAIRNRNRGVVAGAGLTAATLTQFLQSRLPRAAANLVQELAANLYDDITIGGAEWMNGARTSLREFAERSGMRINARSNEWAEGLLDNVGDLVRSEANNVGGTDTDLGLTDDTTLNDLLPGEDMQVDNGRGPPGDGDAEMTLARAAAPGGPGGNPVSKETPISQTQPSYGLQETHTAILPWTGWYSMVRHTKTTPNQLNIRLNSPFNMIPDNINASPGAGAAFISAGLHGCMVDTNGARTASGVDFVTTQTNATALTAAPAWRDYWGTMYQWYTVLGCEYEIIITNPIGTNGCNSLIGVQFDSYSATSTATGNVMPTGVSLQQALAFKNWKWYRTQENATTSGKPQTEGNTLTIKGVYKPGSIKRNITNDGDVKTWTTTADLTGATLPSLREYLTLNFWKHPMDTSVTLPGVNMQINLKYLVQFKDLTQQGRYPNGASSTGSFTLTMDNTANNLGIQKT